MTGDAEVPAPLEIAVRRGSPTDLDLAAAVAVLTESYAAESADAAADAPAPDAWGRSARSLRTSLDRGLGWRGYRG